MTTATQLVVDIDVHTGPPLSSSAEQENPLDNELHDVNADGIQWYLGPVVSASSEQSWGTAGLVVPVIGRATGITTRQTCLIADVVPNAEVRLTTRGWAMRLAWNRSDLPDAGRSALRFELVVNERPPERERRRGQLALSGGGGYGYLAGSRRPASRAVQLVLSDAP